MESGLNIMNGSVQIPASQPEIDIVHAPIQCLQVVVRIVPEMQRNRQHVLLRLFLRLLFVIAEEIVGVKRTKVQLIKGMEQQKALALAPMKRAIVTEVVEVCR